MTSILALAAFAGYVSAQQAGTVLAETHPALTVYNCAGTTGTQCTASQQSIVLDANWRWLHNVGGYTNCYTGNTWNTAYCPNNTACATNCALDGADYSGTYGITTSGGQLKINFITGSNTGARVYLMDSSDTNYQMFKLVNREFSFDTDVSSSNCGLNGALYFVEMPANGDLGVGSNQAGPKYGTGYCDAQCPRDLKFIKGIGNSEGWTGYDANSGLGNFGSCCAEMDVWEANKFGSAYTPHPASITGSVRCTGTDCGVNARYSSLVDADGCDFNSWRMGNRTYFGPGFTVDTTQPFTVVTQFISSDGTDTGDLVEIRRYYVQNGKAIANSFSTFSTLTSYDSITETFCDAQKTLFGDTNAFRVKGGLKSIGEAMKRGMVLVMSIWDDYLAHMLWLDSNYPTDGDATKPGISRGPCAVTSGVPADVRAANPSAYAQFSNIRFGPIGSTTTVKPVAAPVVSASSSSTTTTTTSRSSTTTTTTTTTTTRTSSSSAAASPTPTNCSAKYGQCGGLYWTGAKCCVSGSTCTYSNDYYSQCL